MCNTRPRGTAHSRAARTEFIAPARPLVAFEAPSHAAAAGIATTAAKTTTTRPCALRRHCCLCCHVLATAAGCGATSSDMGAPSTVPAPAAARIPLSTPLRTTTALHRCPIRKRYRGRSSAPRRRGKSNQIKSIEMWEAAAAAAGASRVRPARARDGPSHADLRERIRARKQHPHVNDVLPNPICSKQRLECVNTLRQRRVGTRRPVRTIQQIRTAQRPSAPIKLQARVSVSTEHHGARRRRPNHKALVASTRKTGPPSRPRACVTPSASPRSCPLNKPHWRRLHTGGGGGGITRAHPHARKKVHRKIPLTPALRRLAHIVATVVTSPFRAKPLRLYTYNARAHVHTHTPPVTSSRDRATIPHGHAPQRRRTTAREPPTSLCGTQ